MQATADLDDTTVARSYLAVQGLGTVVWWMCVFVSDDVRRWTLGGWPHELLVVPDLVLFAAASILCAYRWNRVGAIVLSAWTVAITVALIGYALLEREAGWGALLMVLATIGTVASVATLWHGKLPIDWFFVGPFAFVEAKDATPRRHAANSLIQLVVFWTFFLAVLPFTFRWLEHRIRIDASGLDVAWLDGIGAAVFGLASGLGLWSCLSMSLRGSGTPLPAATASTLVIAGPYAFVRNPMAVAGACQTIGVGMWIGAWTPIAAAAVGGVFWHFVIRPAEEADLAARFGADYIAYRERVGVWLPRR